MKTQNGDFCEVRSVGRGAAKITLRLQKGLKRETSDEGEIIKRENDKVGKNVICIYIFFALRRKG